jgi:hypothetical protein
MKKLMLCTALLVSAVAFQSASAQVRVNVNVNIGSQPRWGPAGYDYVEYYYLPDIEAYYYVPSRQFIYLSGSNWIYSYSLPPRYRNYDLYHGYKVVVNEPRAYRYFDSHRVRYSGYRGNRSQVVIQNNYRGSKFKKVKHRNGRGNGRGRGHH